MWMAQNKKGKVISVVDLVLRFQRKTHMQTFYIADLGSDHMILGMPFLAAKNPNINWTTGSFIGKVEAAIINAHRKPLLPYAIDAPTMQQSLEESVRVACKQASF